MNFKSVYGNSYWFLVISIYLKISFLSALGAEIKSW